jgi:hypothetical protein
MFKTWPKWAAKRRKWYWLTAMQSEQMASENLLIQALSAQPLSAAFKALAYL